MKVTVLLSTYNGEKFLAEQLDSILQQKDVKVQLAIRDDGSSDKTIDILREYEKRENIIVTLGEPLGVGRSFMNMLYNDGSDADFYAFADQDDIWDEDKLICGVRAIESAGNGPRLYVCNQRCVDCGGNYISDRFPPDFPVQTMANTLFVNLYAGCTMIFNRALKDKLVDEKRRPDIEFFDHRIHDAWTACVASVFNPIMYDSQCHMSFRRHGNNETDAEILRGVKVKKIIKIKLQIRKIKRLFGRKRRRNSVELTAKNLLIGYSDMMDDNSKTMLLTVSEYRASLQNKLALVRHKYLENGAPEKRADLIVKIIFNRL